MFMYFDFYKTVPVSISIYKDKTAYLAYLKGVLGGNVASSSRESGVYLRMSRRYKSVDSRRDRVLFWLIALPLG